MTKHKPTDAATPADATGKGKGKHGHEQGFWITIKHGDNVGRHVFLRGVRGHETRAQRMANDAKLKHGHGADPAHPEHQSQRAHTPFAGQKTTRNAGTAHPGFRGRQGRLEAVASRASRHAFNAQRAGHPHADKAIERADKLGRAAVEYKGKDRPAFERTGPAHQKALPAPAHAGIKPSTRAMIDSRKPINSGGERRDGLVSSKTVNALRREPMGSGRHSYEIKSHGDHLANKHADARANKASEIRVARNKPSGPSDPRHDRYVRLTKKVTGDHGVYHSKPSESMPVIAAMQKGERGATVDHADLARRRKGVADVLRGSRSKRPVQTTEAPRKPAPGQKSFGFDGPARPSLREQVAAHRASKAIPDRAERAESLKGLRTARHKADLKAINAHPIDYQGPREHSARLTERLYELRGRNPDQGYARGRVRVNNMKQKAYQGRLPIAEGATTPLKTKPPAAAAPPKPAATSLREQAAAHRASKGVADRSSKATAIRDARTQIEIKYDNTTTGIMDKEGNIYSTVRAFKKRNGSTGHEVLGYSGLKGKYYDIEGRYELLPRSEMIDAAKKIARKEINSRLRARKSR